MGPKPLPLFPSLALRVRLGLHVGPVFFFANQKMLHSAGAARESHKRR